MANKQHNQQDFLPTYQFNNTHTKLVNAHELHACLDANDNADSWIINRITQYGFIDEVDYLQLEDNYFLTLDMAKTLAINEQTQRGRDVRYYLIDLEHQQNGVLINSSHHLQYRCPKVKQINMLARSMKLGSDIVILPTLDVINLIQAMRRYQATSSQPQLHISLEWVNNIIKDMKYATGRNFGDLSER